MKKIKKISLLSLLTCSLILTPTFALTSCSSSTTLTISSFLTDIYKNNNTTITINFDADNYNVNTDTTIEFSDENIINCFEYTIINISEGVATVNLVLNSNIVVIDYKINSLTLNKTDNVLTIDIELSYDYDVNTQINNIESGQTVTINFYEDFSITKTELNNLLGESSTVSEVDVTFNLNGYTFSTTDDKSFCTGNKNNITFVSGAIDFSGLNDTESEIVIGANSTLTLDNITANFEGSGILIGDYTIDNGGIDSKLVIKNSSLTFSGNYGLSTNATKNSTKDGQCADGVEIVIEDSTLTIDSNDDSVVILSNIESTWNIKNTTINGLRQCIVVRAGSFTLNDVNINLELTYNSETDRSNPTSWSTGNEVSSGALIVGNNKNSSYLADATVNYESGTISITSSLTTFAHSNFFALLAVGMNTFNTTEYKTQLIVNDVTIDVSNLPTALTSYYLETKNYGESSQVTFTVDGNDIV